MLIEFAKGFVDCLFEVFDCAEEIVVERALFQVSPKPFDGVEFRAVFGKPDDEDVILVFGENLKGGARDVVAGVVENKRDEAVALGIEQLLEELVKLGRVLLRVGQVVRLAAFVVERAIDANPFVGACGGHFRPHPPERPDFRQGRVEVNFTLVEEEQVEVVPPLKRVFFRNSMSSFFSLYSLGSCRCPMTCLGRR